MNVYQYAMIGSGLVQMVSMAVFVGLFRPASRLRDIAVSLYLLTFAVFISGFRLATLFWDRPSAGKTLDKGDYWLSLVGASAMASAALVFLGVYLFRRVWHRQAQ